MPASLKKTVKRLRFALAGLCTAFGLAFIIQPASAADSVTGLSGSAIAIIILIGLLLFAIVFEVWRTVLRRPVPFHDPATHDWNPKRRV